MGGELVCMTEIGAEAGHCKCGKLTKKKEGKTHQHCTTSSESGNHATTADASDEDRVSIDDQGTSAGAIGRDMQQILQSEGPPERTMSVEQENRNTDELADVAMGHEAAAAAE